MNEQKKYIIFSPQYRVARDPETLKSKKINICKSSFLISDSNFLSVNNKN